MNDNYCKGHGYFRKSKAYGLVCGIALAGVFAVTTNQASADQVSSQTAPVTQTAPVNEPELVTSPQLDQAVSAAKQVGVTVTTTATVNHATVSVAKADLATQTASVVEATKKQEANTAAIKKAVEENQVIDQKNAASKAQIETENQQAQEEATHKNQVAQAEYQRKLAEIKQIEAENAAIRKRNEQAQEAAARTNQAAQAEYQQKLAEIKQIEAENAAIRDRNAKAQQEAERQNQALQAAYEAKLAEIKQIESENAAIRKRNEQAAQATHQANQAAQAAYQEKLAEIERIKAENAAIRDRNAKAQQEAERQNQALQAAYEAKLAEIKQIEAENEAIRQRNEQAGQATNQTNQAAQAAYQEKLAEIERIKAENAAIRDSNAKAQQEAERQNQALQAAYEAKLAEIKQIESENAAIRKRNEQAAQATNQTNQAAQAEYQQKLAEIERINAENAAIRDRNAKARQEAERQNQALQAAYEAQLSAYQQALQAKKEAENKAIDQVVFGIDAKANGVDNAEYGNSIMTVTTQPDGTFVFKHDMIDGVKTIGYGTLTGKINHHYEANKDGSITAYIDSVTFDKYEYQNVAKNDAVDKNIVFRILSATGRELFVKAHDGDKTFSETLNKTVSLKLTYQLKPHEAVKDIKVFQLHDDWVHDTHGSALVSYTNNNDAVPHVEVPDKPVQPDIVTPKVEQEKPVPEAPQKPTDGVPNLEKEKPVPPTPVKPEAVKPVLEQEKPVPEAPQKPTDDVPNLEQEKPVPPKPAEPKEVKPKLEQEKPVPELPQKPAGETPNLEQEKPVPPKPAEPKEVKPKLEQEKPVPELPQKPAGETPKLEQEKPVPSKPVEPNLVTPLIKPFKPENYVSVPEKVTYTVAVHPVQLPKANPVKAVVDLAGSSINGQSILPNTTLNYVAKQDFSQYKGINASQEVIAKNFMFIDDYKDEALDGQSLVVNGIKAANGDDVTNLLEMRHVLSQDTLDDKLKALIKASGISPVGEFYLWVAKDPAAFYKAYVQKGLDITYNLSFKVKTSFTEGQIKNGVAQIDFGNGYVGNIVVNDLLALKVHKDVLSQDGKSINNGTVKIGDEVTYQLEGWVVPAKRGYDLTEYKFVDQLQHTHDLYQKDKVIAKVDVTFADGTIITKGTDLSKYTETVYNKDTGRYELAFKADFLAQIPRTSEFGADAFVVVKRIKAGDVANEYILYVNGNPVKSNKVTTHTPEPPQPVTPKAPALPSTGDQEVSMLSMIGAAMLSVLGFVGIKHRQN
ncbi:SspB-related isopeptide-forming adhesin [Streptococcus equi]|uniref:SspB-related isopeptide-forming adhesin n=1 Tax=Streptococcus equi TaxID=1336 RepID=UPI001E5C42B2|nr:SspB-related isopeptide-forming adhesin [Streptococcus equi]MCD3409311.1 LPXTG cell wall anchor domain-containing protein [Streptococcus equi subsp. zooepidemicus]